MVYRTSRGRLCVGVMVALFFTALVAPATCDVISYTTVAAKYDIQYDPIFEDPDPLMPLFQPLGFDASSVAAVPPIDFADGTMIVTVTPLDGVNLQGITFLEGGDYTLAGAVGQTSQAWVNATLFVDCTYLEIDGVANTSIDLDSYQTFDRNLTLSPGNLLAHGFWALQYAIDLSGIDGRVTKLKFSIDNSLLASSQVSSSAFIAKKRFSIEDGTVPVPEPSIFALFAAGICLGVVRRHR